MTPPTEPIRGAAGGDTPRGESSPRKRSAWPLLVFGLIAAGLIGLSFGWDQTVMHWVTQRRDALGRGLNLTLVIVGFFGFIQIWRSLPNGTRLVIGFLAPVALSAAITHLLKGTIGRARPFLERGVAEYSPMTLSGEYASFPSGHTSYAFCVATIFFIYWPRTRWPILIWAPAVAFERILTDKHFLSDVLGGAAIGVFSAWICFKMLGDSFYLMNESLPRQSGTPAQT